MRELNIDVKLHQEKISPNRNLVGDEKERKLIEKYNKSIDNIKEKFELLDLDISEEIKENLLRGQIFLLLSSVDFYIHEIVKIELMNIIKQERKVTSNLKKCDISVEALIKYISFKNLDDQILEKEIMERNSYKTFMSGKKMEEVLSLITKKKVFSELYQKMDFTKKEELEKFIKEIYQRRNKIAHQMDYDYISGVQNSILKSEVEKYINFYRKFINELHSLLIEENI